MKKIITSFLILLFGVISSSNAQLEEGTFMIGSDLGSGLSTSRTSGLLGLNLGLNEGAGLELGISPKAGFFLNDNFLIGGIVNLGYSKSPESQGESTHTFSYAVQGLTRYYIIPQEADLDNIVNSGRFFLETNAGIAGVNVKDGPTTNGFAYGFGPGYSYFLTPNVALEATAKYSGLVGAGNTDYQNSLGINLGIQVFIPRAQANDALRDLD